MQRKGSHPRYSLIIGDLTIDQVIILQDVVQKSPEAGADLRRKVTSAAEVIWDTYFAVSRFDKLWHWYCDEKFPKRKRAKKSA